MVEKLHACPICNTIVSEDDSYCPWCGEDLDEYRPEKQKTHFWKWLRTRLTKSERD
jgi:predicted nucleic acid-binding Zn ribbon protein